LPFVFDQLQAFFNTVKPVFDAAIGFLFGLLVGLFARYRSRKAWQRGHLIEQLNVSLNVLSGDELKIRTILERPIGEIILNQHARERVIAASKKTTDDDPLILLPGADHSFILNYILNATAEHFSAASVRADLGIPTLSAKYALFLTCEPATDERHRKIRAMLLKRDLMENFPYDDGALPKLERPHHADRIKTLRVASRKFKENPELFPMLELSA
jgi:hypothetical protein